MPALLILAVISWLFGTGKSRPKKEVLPLFTALEVRPRRRWGVFCCSVVAHVFSIVLLFTLSDLFAVSDDDLLMSRLTSRPLVIRLPEHIYLAPASGRNFPSTARVPPNQHVAIRRNDLRKYAESGAVAKLTETPPAATERGLFSLVTPPPEPVQAEPRKFALPDLPVQDTKTQTVLQAELPSNLPPQVEKQLPQLLFWDAEPSKPPERPVQPGNLTARTEAPKLNATPRPEPPNVERLTSDFRVASSPATTHSILTLPPATTMPLRVLTSQKNPTGPISIDPFIGDPVHVLAVSPNPAPLTDALKAIFIPPGNQLARLPGVSPLFGFPGFGEGPDGSGAAGSSGEGGSGVDDGTAGGAPGGAQLLHSFPGEGQLFGILSPPGLTGTPLRILHPNNGVFDVVVVQSSSSEAFVEGSAALSGRPIYTVYLQVGASKEWILQFCVPNMPGPVQTGGLVKLGNPTPVGAPYPTVTVRPPEDWQHGGDYLLVHGFLDESGRFRDMRILPGEQPASASAGALLEYLAYWEFRPAVQDGRPIKVEVILAVPPDRLS